MLTKTKQLLRHSGFQKYFKNTSWLLGEKMLRLIAGLFIGVWVSRYLGPARFGLFSYVQSFVALFAVIATLGLDSIIVRELVKDESKRDVLLGTAFVLKLIGAIIVLILLALAINFTSNDSYTNILVFIVASAVIFKSFDVIDFYFQSKVLSKFVVFANSITLTISSIIKIVLILKGAPLIAFVFIVAFDSLVLALGFLYFYLHNKLSIRQWRFEKSMAVRLLRDSWPLILSGIVVSVYMRIDQVMIKEMLGSEAVGQYAAAVRISELWYFIPVVITSSLFPAIINAKKQSEALYYARLQNLYNMLVWMAIAIAVPMTFLSKYIIQFLYGSPYAQAGNVLMIHIWTGIFVSLGVASGKWFISENLQMLSFWRTFYGMVFNITLNFILIPKYGIQGAAIATLVSQIVAAYIYDLFHDKTRKTFIMKTKAMLLITLVNKRR